jgi:predicted regulator of Ras-like GTPase activity (Roadblock/LC7/MglB family)
MFKDALQDVVDKVDGGVAAMLMGFDGIAVEQYSPSGFDIETLGMEFSVVLNDARKAALALDAGETDEVAFRAEKVMAVIRVLNGEYFLALAMKPGGNLGKGRYLLRLAAPRVLKEL